MQNKKVTLWTIITLLIIFIPITIFSFIMHNTKKPVIEDNPNHEFKYENKLYFYNDNDELLGIYSCNKAICDMALNSSNEDYPLREKQSSDNLSLVMNRFAFIKDVNNENDKNIILYDLELGRVLANYSAIKNYGIGIEDNNYIVKNNDNHYGVITFKNNVSLKVPFKYDYIGLPEKIDSETGKIVSNKFAVLNNGKWQIIDANGAVFAENISDDIVNFNEEYIVLKSSFGYRLANYQGRYFFDNTIFKYLDFYKDYLEVIDNNSNFYLYSIKNNQKVSSDYLVNSIDDVSLSTENNTIIIAIKNSEKERVAITS